MLLISTSGLRRKEIEVADEELAAGIFDEGGGLGTSMGWILGTGVFGLVDTRGVSVGAMGGGGGCATVFVGSPSSSEKERVRNK